MADMQKMLDGTLAPVGPHRDDLIECSDGSTVRYEDIEFTDCRGGVHSCEDDMNDANDEIVGDLLDAEDSWIGEYVASDDYGDEYAYLVMESSHGWRDRIEEWVEDKHPKFDGSMLSTIVDDLSDKIDSYDIEGHYQNNEYANYFGNGCCLNSYQVGEYEDQIIVDDREEFKALHESGDLEGCLDRYNGDLCINENSRYDAESGRRVKCGYVSKGEYPMFYGYSAGWGCWHYAVSDERMEKLLSEVIASYCRRTDK